MGGTTGVTLKDVKEISKPGVPLKDSFFIASTNIENWRPGPADAKLPSGDCESSNTNSVCVITPKLICFTFSTTHCAIRDVGTNVTNFRQRFGRTLVSARERFGENATCRRFNPQNHRPYLVHLRPTTTGEIKIHSVPERISPYGTNSLPTSRCLVSRRRLTRRFTRPNLIGPRQTSERGSERHSAL